jgi:hypothetical protein
MIVQSREKDVEVVKTKAKVGSLGRGVSETLT